MPRPRRTRATQDTAPLRVAEIRNATQNGRFARQASPASSERTAAISTDSDEMVTRNTSGRNRRGIAAKRASMRGAIVLDDAERIEQSQASGQDLAEDRGRTVAVARGNVSKGKRETKIQMGNFSNGRDGVQKKRSDTIEKQSGGPRTQSILGTGVNSLRPRPESSLLGSTFKPRQRKPSLLHTLQAQQGVAGDVDINGDSDIFDINSLGPDDESMSLRSSASRHDGSTQTSAQQHSSASRKRKRDEAQVPALQVRGTLPSFGSSPRASLEPQEDGSKLLARDSFSIRSDTPLSDKTPSSPRPSLPRRQQPLQSSPARSSSQSPLSTLSSAPDSPKKLQKRNPPTPKPLTTARLQNLLPRRRIRKSAENDESGLFDLQSSDNIEPSVALSSEADELSYYKPKAPPRRKANVAGAPRGNKSLPSKSNVSQNHRTKSNTTGKTYSRSHRPTATPTTSDLDASGEDEENIPPAGKAHGSKAAPKLPSPAKKRLAATARWFKEEVDSWALEVEDVSVHSQSSAMRDAR